MLTENKFNVESIVTVVMSNAKLYSRIKKQSARNEIWILMQGNFIRAMQFFPVIFFQHRN